MTFLPTEEQQTAIGARGSILVSAAAGSGKTKVLTERVVARITDPIDPVDISDLLIVTFTNNAAAEMRRRISGALAEYLDHHKGDRRALEQKADLDSAAISTIDAFCIDLLRGNFDETGVSPDFRVISEERTALLCDRAAREALNALMLSDPDAFRDMMTALWDNGDFLPAVSEVIAAYNKAATMPYPKVWLERIIREYERDLPLNDRIWTKEMLAGTGEAADYHIQRLQAGAAMFGDNDVAVSKFADVYAEMTLILQNVLSAVESGSYDAVRAAVLTRPTCSVGRGRKGSDPERIDTLKAILDGARDFMAKESSSYCETAAEQEENLRRVGRAIVIFCRTVMDYADRLLAQMQEINSYDFNAIEHKALEFLCDCVDGRPVPKQGEWNRRYREVMVDEYQDTNDLQDAIFYALSDSGKNLFLVGDVKQCIYRFRQANPANFIRKRNELPAYAAGNSEGVIALPDNFRSRPEICDFVNHTFRLLMTTGASDMEYADIDTLRASAVFAPDAEPPVTLHLLETNDAAGEARYIAKALREARARGMLVSDRGNNGVTMRPMRWSDVTILLRSPNGANKTASVYVNALAAAGIPAVSDSNDDLNEREEIRLILSLLRTIDNPLRDVPLLATLLSPMFGFTSDEIVRIRLADPGRGLYAALKADAAVHHKSSDFLSRLDRYRRWAGTLPTDRLIRMVMDDVGLTAVVHRMEHGAYACANLMLFVSHAARYERDGFCGLTAFLRSWDRIIKQKKQVKCAPIQSGEDAVRVLSIHGSKGLESPVVILADTAKGTNQKDNTEFIVYDENMGIAARCYDEDAVSHKTVAQMAVSRRGRKDTNAEELRLLYVAMTRAIDRLWMVVRCKDRDKALHGAALSLIPSQGRKDRAPFPYAVSSAGHMSDWLLFVCLLHPDAYGLREHSGLALLPSQSEGRLHVVMGDIPEPLTEEPAAPDGESMDFSPYLDFEYPYRNILNFEAKYSVSQLAKADRADVGACRSRPAFVTGDRLTPAEKGTATHRFMCFADYDRARVSVQTEIDRLVAEGRLTPAQGEGIDVATVEAFFDSDLYRRVQAADRVLKESRFLYEMPVRRLDPDCDSDETVVVQGVADLVLFEADGVTIVDFKTDRGCTPEGLKEKYTRQLAVYADAFSVDYHLPKKTPYLYSFFLRQAVPLPEAVTNSKKI